MRKQDGRETFDSLLKWDKGSTPSERMAATLLASDGFNTVDPSHPLGGPDGGKDVLLKKNDDVLIAAVYFARGQQSFSEIKTKFSSDCEGIQKSDSSGIIFFTNQELRLAERKQLRDVVPDYLVDIYHLERVALLLNLPVNYGVRQEYLQIEMTREETTAFLAQRDLEHLSHLSAITNQLENSANEINNFITGGNSYPLYFMGQTVQDVGIPYYCIVKGKYPLYDANVCFRYTYNDEITQNFKNKGYIEELKTSIKPDWTKCGVLTPVYSQLLTHLKKPLQYPAHVEIQTYARNSVFTQKCGLSEDLQFTDIIITDNSGAELMNEPGPYVVQFNSS